MMTIATKKLLKGKFDMISSNLQLFIHHLFHVSGAGSTAAGHCNKCHKTCALKHRRIYSKLQGLKHAKQNIAQKNLQSLSLCTGTD